MRIKESAQERCATPWHAKNNDPLGHFTRHRLDSCRRASCARLCRLLASTCRELANVFYIWLPLNVFDHYFLRWRVADEVNRAYCQAIGPTAMDPDQVSLVQDG